MAQQGKRDTWSHISPHLVLALLILNLPSTPPLFILPCSIALLIFLHLHHHWTLLLFISLYNHFFDPVKPLLSPL